METKVQAEWAIRSGMEVQRDVVEIRNKIKRSTFFVYGQHVKQYLINNADQEREALKLNYE